MLQITIILWLFHGTGCGGCHVHHVTIGMVVVSSCGRRKGGCGGVGIVFGEVARVHCLIPRREQFEHGHFVGGEGGMADALDFVVEFPTFVLFPCGNTIRMRRESPCNIDAEKESTLSSV